MTPSKEFSLKIITGNWQFILLIVAFFSSVTFFVSAIIPPKFESNSEILILQKNMDVDAYRAAKSSEFAGEVLKKVIGSSDFMNGVLLSVGATSQKFGDNPEDQIKKWNDEVAVSTYVNTGIIKIAIFDESKKENKQIMEGVLSELQNNGLKYHGNENITLKKIGGPVYYNNPSFPIIWLNILIAVVVAIFFSIGAIFIFGEKKLEEHLMSPVERSTDKNGKLNFFNPQKEEALVLPEEDYFASFQPKVFPLENSPISSEKEELEKVDIFPEEKEIVFPEATSEEVKARLNKLLGGKL
jgi:capsular polysaccharide biosynthesis protein